MSDTLIEAGAILVGEPADTTGVDAATARAYRHPVLPGRTVVRIVGATVGPAEDLTMEFLGFTAAAEPVPVGYTRRQALGFPAWALVHDPANGRHALALVKEMEKLARAARSKPGNAKDGYNTLAERLGQAAPQFLPTFWEQAGRAFVAAGNQRMAATCFTAARRAELIHGLVVDEDRLRDVHLEFAFTGGLTAAMLAEYTRGVVDRRPAPEAYELVKTLSLRRVAGGLPPHVSMGTDLSRLAKAAGLDCGHQADEVVAHLLTYPAIKRAHPSVWKAYRKNLVGLGKRDAAVRARLLEIIPEPPGYDTDLTDQWLELLDASGATADLLAGEHSAGRWLERFLAGRRRNRRSARLIEFTERLLPRLTADETGVRLGLGSWRLDLDILDLCLAGGVNVIVDPPAQGLGVAGWSSDQGSGRRDLAAIAADPRLRPALVQGVRGAISAGRHNRSLTDAPHSEQTLREAFGAAGVRDALAEFLADRAARAGGATVATLDADLTELAPLWSPTGLRLAPGDFLRLAEADLAAVLARTLRAGVTAELCWPAYEEATRQKKAISIGGSWPQLVVHDNQSAHVIEPDGSSTEHVFRYPPAGDPHEPSRYSRTSCVYVDGDLLTAWRSDRAPVAYWSSRPGEPFEADWHLSWSDPWTPLPVPGGGLTTGARPVHAGDARSPGELHAVASDGRSFWRRDWLDTSTQRSWRWREFDPGTGNSGRFSLPAFFEAAAGGELVPETCHLRPAPEQFAGSPLGWNDGLVGWRTTRTPDGRQIGEGVDGRRVTIAPQPKGWATQQQLVAAVLLPGATAPLPVTYSGYNFARLRLWTADGEYLLCEEQNGTTKLPPLTWWHALRPRDEAGSAALRAIDETTTAALLAIGDTVTALADVTKAVEANLAEHLPAVTDATLLSRLTEIIARAVRLRRRLAEIPGHLGNQEPSVAAAPSVTDDELYRAWSGLCDARRTYYYGGAGRRCDLIEQVSAVGRVLGGKAPAGDIPAVSGGWTTLLGGLGAVALRSASPVTGDDDRVALAGFLTAVGGTPLAGDGPPLRLIEVTQDERATDAVTILRDGDQVTVLFPAAHHHHAGKTRWRRDGIQVAPDGAFAVPGGMPLTGERRPGGRLRGHQVGEFVTLLAERGPIVWRPQAVDQLTELTGMTRAEATLILAGLPGLGSWEANFLTPAQRTMTGITATQAKVAREALRDLTMGQRVALLGAGIPAAPADLWEHGPDVAAIAEQWIRVRGRRIAVPENLVADLARVVNDKLAASVLQGIASPQPGDWLSTDGTTTFAGVMGTTKADSGQAFDEGYLYAAAVALPWLAYTLRWDDPLRTALPEALRLIRLRLRNPGLRVGYGMRYVDARPDVGPALVDGASYPEHFYHHVAPAHLTGPDDPALGFINQPSALRILLSGWIDDVVAIPAPIDGEPHDPRVGAPGVVAEVSERFGIGTEAAAYYLQLLALPDPADKAVRAWNGWTAAALGKARDALVATGLVVAAKRERAGRTAFLPGGWQPAKAPRQPLEAWKQQLYADTGALYVTTKPLPELFAAAWARIVAGDVPRYRDLEEKP